MATALIAPVFSRAEDAERPKSEVQLEVAPTAGYGRHSGCESLQRVRYGGLGAAVRFRQDVLAMKIGGSVGLVRTHTTTYDDSGAIRDDTQTVVEGTGLAQLGLDWRYFAMYFGAATNLSSDTIVLPSGSLRFGRSDQFAFRLSFADALPMRLALASAELEGQYRRYFRAALGVRADLSAVNVLPGLRIEVPCGTGHWLGMRGAVGYSQGAPAWQLQLLATLQLNASPPTDSEAPRQ